MSVGTGGPPTAVSAPRRAVRTAARTRRRQQPAASWGGAFYRPPAKSRQRKQSQLDHRARARRDRRRGTAPHARDPDDVAAGVDERHPIALPARDLRVDQKRFEPAIAAAEGPEAIALAPRTHEQARGYAGGIEGHTVGASPHRVIAGGSVDGFASAARQAPQARDEITARLVREARQQCMAHAIPEKSWIAVRRILEPRQARRRQCRDGLAMAAFDERTNDAASHRRNAGE